MNETVSGPAYRIETPRLVVRCWQPADAFMLREAVESSVDHLLPWLPWAQAEPEELQAKVDRLRMFRGKFDLGEDYVYGIFDRQEGRVIGGSGLHTRVGPGAREIGYWIRKDEIGHGYATEVSAALTKVAFEIDRVDRVEIRCDPENVRSAAIPAKLGFEQAWVPSEVKPADGISAVHFGNLRGLVDQILGR